MNTHIGHKWTTQTPKRRTTGPVAKPARTPRELVIAEEQRRLNEEGTLVWDLLSDAALKCQAKNAHHLLDRVLALQERVNALNAECQAMAGEGSQERLVAA